MKGEKAYDAGSIVPALAQNARAGHPLFVLCPRFQRLGHPSVWLLAVIGVIGIGIGVFAFSTGSKVAGTICVLTNIPVLAYWGFVGCLFLHGWIGVNHTAAERQSKQAGCERNC
jgi:hypothetical protein